MHSVQLSSYINYDFEISYNKLCELSMTIDATFLLLRPRSLNAPSNLLFYSLFHLAWLLREACTSMSLPHQTDYNIIKLYTCEVMHISYLTVFKIIQNSGLFIFHMSIFFDAEYIYLLIYDTTLIVIFCILFDLNDLYHSSIYIEAWLKCLPVVKEQAVIFLSMYLSHWQSPLGCQYFSKKLVAGKIHFSRYITLLCHLFEPYPVAVLLPQEDIQSWRPPGETWPLWKTPQES